MEKIHFENTAECADYMVEKFLLNLEICAVLFYDDTVDLIKELATYKEVKIKSIEIHSSELDGYDKEYYVSLDKDGYLYVEPAYRDKEYICLEDDMLVLIPNNANYSIIKEIPNDNCREIYIGIDNNYGYNCEDCCRDCCICPLMNDDEDFCDHI